MFEPLNCQLTSKFPLRQEALIHSNLVPVVVEQPDPTCIPDVL